MDDRSTSRDRSVVVPGSRDVRGTLDGPADPDHIVVACPPHPRHGGTRTDARLRAVGDALADRGVGCLRIDYGPWDGGHGERTDVRAAIRWASERADRVSVFGYSFGGSTAILAAAGTDDAVAAVAALAPTATLGRDLDAVAAIDALDAGTRLAVVCGVRDDTADWQPVCERARSGGHTCRELSADHFFVGQTARIVDVVVPFLLDE